MANFQRAKMVRRARNDSKRYNSTFVVKERIKGQGKGCFISEEKGEYKKFINSGEEIIVATYKNGVRRKWIVKQ